MKQVDLVVGEFYAVKHWNSNNRVVFLGTEKKSMKRRSWETERFVSHAKVRFEDMKNAVLIPFKDILHPWSVEETLIKERDEREAIRRHNVAIADKVIDHLKKLGLSPRPHYGGVEIVSFEVEQFAKVLGVDLEGI